MSKRGKTYGRSGQEAFYTVTMDNGKSSKALMTLSDVAVFLDEYINGGTLPKELVSISAINIKKKYRKGPSMRMSEIDSEIEINQRRLEHLTQQRSALEAQIEAEAEGTPATIPEEAM